jgi:hypothetical protein
MEPLFTFDEFKEDVIQFVMEDFNYGYDSAEEYAESLHDYFQDGYSAREAVLHDFSHTLDEVEEENA